jgi:AcrR family transcriptional regulator
MTPRPERPPRRLPREKRREQLVEIALERIADHGFDEYSLDEVAEEADVSRNLLYRYFPRGRQDLSLAVVERVMSEFADRWIVDPELAPEERRDLNLGRFVRHGFEATPEWRVYRRVLGVADQEAIALLDDFHTRWVDRIATNNGIDASDTMTAVGLRAMIGFACEAIDHANVRGVPPEDVIELIFGAFGDVMRRCGSDPITTSPGRRRPTRSNS